MVSALRASLDFLEKFGFFDVILPFLLVFTIVFGILEKTKIFGTEEVEGKKYPKRNINAMIAVVIAFFVVAAKNIVSAIQVSLPQIALVLIVLVSFMMLAGSFFSDKEFTLEKRKGWVVFLTLLIFIGVILIFMNSFGWLTPTSHYLSQNTENILTPIIFLAIVLGLIFYVVGGGGKGEREEKE